MALGSLIVAAAAVWFIRFNMPENEPPTSSGESAEMVQLVKELDEKTTAHETQLLEIKQLTARIESLEAGKVQPAVAKSRLTDQLPADTPPTTDDDASDIDKLFSARNGDADPVDEGTPEEDVTAATEGDDADENGLNLAGMNGDGGEAADEQPSILRVVQTALRPLNEEYAVTLTLRNTSNDTPAVISKVIFSPKEVVEDVSTELAMKPIGKSTESEFAMAFGPEHNQSRGSSRQGSYVRLLSERFTIPPGEEVKVRLGINDREHIGYGLLGSLTLEFNTTESLEVPSLALAFLGGE